MSTFKDLKPKDYFVVLGSLVYYQKTLEMLNSNKSAFVVNAKIILRPEFRINITRGAVLFKTPGRVRGYISPNTEVQKVEQLPKRFEYFELPFIPQ